MCRLQRWLDIEVALAECQEELGVIPKGVAATIRKVARIDLFDLDDIGEGIARTGHSFVSLLRAFERACGGYVGQFLHHGATTQDIQDTGMALEMRDVLQEIDAGLAPLLRRLGQLAFEHRDHIMVGRTHAQPALPMTFGLKVAGWIDELMRQRARLREMAGRVLVVELFGGVGTMAGFGPSATKLVEAFGRRLGLGVPMVSWHVVRDRVAEYVSNLAMLTATLARIADEIRTLSRPEFQELEERWEATQVGSSTMPHKRNPEKCEQVVVLARLTRTQVPLALEAMILEHERDYRGTRLEWPAVGDVSHYTLAALDLMRDVIGGLRIHSDRMRGTTAEQAQAACTEAMMLTLGSLLGKARAFKLVHALSQRAIDRNISLVELAKQTPEVTSLIDEQMLEKIFDPAAHLGASGELVDRVLDHLEEQVGVVRTLAMAPPAPPRPPEGSDLPARAQPRYELVLRVEYAWEDEFQSDYLTDLSEGGMRLRTSVPLRIGQRLTVRLSLGKLLTPLEIEAEVRWVDASSDPLKAGVAFTRMAPEVRERLETLIKAAQPDPRHVVSCFRCVMFETDPVLQRVYAREVRDFTEYYGHLNVEITNVATVKDWRTVVEDGVFDLGIVDLDGFDSWEGVLATPMPLVLLGGRSAGEALGAQGDQRIEFLEKPLKFGSLLRTLGTLLKLGQQS